MNTATAIGLSGFHAGERKIGGAAHNLANFLTEDFRPVRVRQQAAPQGGAETTVETAVAPEPVDVALELINQATGAFQAKASLRVVETALDMLGTLIDLEV